MLEYEPTKRNGGFILWGDYSTLKPIHSLIMDVSQKSPVLNSEGLLPALAYDIRKAYEGRREQDKQTVWDDEITVYGVEQVWPTFITQVALLRTALAFAPFSKNQHGLTYLIEAFLDDMLRSVFPAQATAILRNHMDLIGQQEAQLSPLLGSRVSYFLELAPAKRRDNLSAIIASMDPLYGVRFGGLSSQNTTNMPHPSEFEGRSWSDLDLFEQKTIKL